MNGGNALHPLRGSFWNKHGLHYGFFTPSMIMASHKLLRANTNPRDDEIRRALTTASERVK